ncbi:BED-type domain-containing protein [Meloidogyne graminicola]|uniref:BED-type domain-containing protein n=1 Tax=Meloidogyne graminicola TaxID=189291 RepID=A0A8S9ZGM1_9BILA|nr:BED-type domain-containing protein [Meloidogyne graminicola]
MSGAWTFFEKLNNNKAICILCKQHLDRKHGSTRGLWIHLRTKHHAEFKRLKPIYNVSSY